MLPSQSDVAWSRIDRASLIEPSEDVQIILTLSLSIIIDSLSEISFR